MIVRSIANNYRNLFRYLVLSVVYYEQHFYIHSCIMEVFLKFTIFYIFSMFAFKFLHIYTPFSYDFYYLFVNNLIFFLFKINCLHCVLSLSSHKIFHVIFTFVYIMHFSMISNDDIFDIEKPHRIFLPSLDLVDYPRLYLHPSIFSIKH